MNFYKQLLAVVIGITIGSIIGSISGLYISNLVFNMTNAPIPNPYQPYVDGINKNEIITIEIPKLKYSYCKIQKKTIEQYMPEIEVKYIHIKLADPHYDLFCYDI